jgi:hypothetical protein
MVTPAPGEAAAAPPTAPAAAAAAGRSTRQATPTSASPAGGEVTPGGEWTRKTLSLHNLH